MNTKNNKWSEQEASCLYNILYANKFKLSTAVDIFITTTESKRTHKSIYQKAMRIKDQYETKLAAEEQTYKENKLTFWQKLKKWLFND